jgi:8-oxo-dGTP pyrophosphatase MutT (NUDIX family)
MLQNAVKATVAYQGKMLVIMHDDPSGAWAGVPGGSIEDGEDPLRAMCREFMEEICVLPSQIIPLEVIHNEDGTWCQRYFVPLTDEEAASVSLGDEGFELRWCTFDEMLGLKLSPMGRAYYESDAGQGMRKRIEETVTES